MRELRYVKQAGEGALVVETADGLEQFQLPVDDGLREALREFVRDGTPRPRPSAVPTAPPIGPRDIQVRVRAGESPTELAEACGASIDWVLRFAGPVLDERERVADEGRRARARRSTTDGQWVVFGEAVDERFAAHGIEPGTIRWDARRREDGQWIISAHWVGGDAERSAEWTFALGARTVAALDDTAADLLSDRPIRPLTPVLVEPTLSAALAPPLAPGVVAFPAMADARTGPLPTIPRAEEVFDQAAFGDDSPEPPGGTVEDLFDIPLLPLGMDQDVHADDDSPAPARADRARHASGRRRRLTEFGIPTRGAESEEDRAARAAIPSWDDILLGVRRKQD
jgi:hypothetical protein